MSVAAALLMLAAQTDDLRTVAVEQIPDDRCIVTIEGRALDLERDRPALESVFFQAPGAAWRVSFDRSEDTPHRCIGGVVYLMQQRGIGIVEVVAVPANVAP